jgi:FAD/FMN-containing dehydrogenase
MPATLHGWGRFPKVEAQVALPLSDLDCKRALQARAPLIAHGLGRSYGDSALAHEVLSTRYLDHLTAFDASTGLLTCAAGVSLDTILRQFVPRGWFLPVTPGTRFATVGGAIASDVHGKNHHVDGTLCAHVRRFDLLLGNGEQVTASPAERADLFHATCGGMGLTGVILAATVQLRPIRSSEIIQTMLKAHSLDAVLEALHGCTATYSVAWIDCVARGRNLGRSLLMLGEHAPDGALRVQARAPCPVPLDLPATLLNRFTAAAFNALYYRKMRRAREVRRVPFEQFFYPLDALSYWNRIYGKAGLLQYQFVLPKEACKAGVREVIRRIADSGLGSYLAVLKLFGPSNDNLLSFPREGCTLALDFKVEPEVFDLLDTLDRIVLDHGGRLYLAKDARMSAATFRAGYPRWQEFEAVRARWHAHGRFASLQSKRLGLS